MTNPDWLTFEQVQTVADELWRNKKSVSAQAIREVLQRGSMATIQKHLTAWRKQLDHALPALPDPVTQAVQKVWQTLELQTKNQINQIQTDAQVEIASLNEKLIAEQERHASELHTLLEQKRVISAGKDLLQTSLIATQAELTAETQARLQAEANGSQLEHRLVEQSQAFEKQAQWQQQLHDQALHLLREQIKQLKQEHQQAIQQCQAWHEQQVKIWEAQRASLQRKLTLAEQQCQQQEDSAQQTIQALKSQLTKEQQHYKELLSAVNTDNKALTQELTESNKQVAELQGEVRQLRLLAEERKSELSDAHAALFELQHQFVQLKVESKESSEQL